MEKDFEEYLFEQHLYEQQLKESTKIHNHIVKRSHALMKMYRKQRVERFILALGAAVLIGGAAFHYVSSIVDDLNGGTKEDGTTISDPVMNFSNKSIIKEALKPYMNILKEETYMTDSKEHIWYNTGNIASKLVETGNVDYAFYAYYKNMRGDVSKNLGEVVDLVSQFDVNNEVLDGDYRNFEEYLTAKGYSNEKGKIDYDRYDKDMKNSILDSYELEQNIQGVDNGRKL